MLGEAIRQAKALGLERAQIHGLLEDVLGRWFPVSGEE
jgi:hypothetical protein